MGNALVVDADSEQPLIRPKGGFGGLSGPSVKYTALANVKKLRELLRKDIDVIGVGGVRTLVVVSGVSHNRIVTFYSNT